MNKNYAFWVLVLLVGYLAYLLLKEFWQFLAFALIFAVIFNKPYRWLARRVHRNIAALIVVLGILLVLVLPTIYVLHEAVQQVPLAYQSVIGALEKEAVRDAFGVSGDEVRRSVLELGNNVRTNVVQNAAAYFSQITTILVGMFILFVSTFFFLRDGKKMYGYITETFPARKHNTQAFLAKMHNLTDALLLGHLVTAVVQGTLAGVLFWILGVPNPLLLGIFTILVSIIPIFGPFITYIPVAGYLFVVDRYIAAIVLLAFGVVVISQIDNVIRPYIAGRTARIHPLIVIIGVIAGLKLMGFIGFIIGPLVLAGFFALFEFLMTGDETALKKGKV